MSMPRSWRRFAALFLLLWAAVDICVPSLCEADSDLFLPQQAQQTAVNHAEKGGPPAPLPADDDCFCCSSHVSPTPHFELSAVIEKQPVFAVVPVIRLLDFSEPHYHPPRA